MAEDLEYHATFPPNVNTEDSESRGKFSSRGGRNEPLVILLGWLGCVDKHLAKYSAIYQSKGYATIRYTAPAERHFYQPEKLKDTSLKILELIFDLGLEESPIFFHVFSNGGAVLYRHVTEIIHGPFAAEFAALNIAGCVYDSGPTKPTIASAIRAMSAAANPKASFVARLFRIVIFIIMTMLSVFFPSTWEGNRIRRTFFKALREDRARFPQLFLYSKADSVCRYKDVESLVAARGELGVNVRQVCWEDSAHCSHLLLHKEEYVRVCLRFVEDCLQNILEDSDSQDDDETESDYNVD